MDGDRKIRARGLAKFFSWWDDHSPDVWLQMCWQPCIHPGYIKKSVLIFTHASSSLGDCFVRLKLRPLLVYLLSEGSSFLWNTFWICMTALWSALSCLKQLENCILVTRLVFSSYWSSDFFRWLFFVSILLFLLKHLQRKCVTGMELSYKAQSS